MFNKSDTSWDNVDYEIVNNFSDEHILCGYLKLVFTKILGLPSENMTSLENEKNVRI